MATVWPTPVMASATLEYNGAQVTNSLNSQRARFEQFAGNTRAFADSIAEMAEALLGIEGEEQTEAAMLAINELLDTEAEVKAYGAALAAIQNSYVPGARTTNFKKDLDQHAARLLPSLRLQPEMKQYYQDVSQRLEIEDESAQQQDGDDDEVQMGGSNTGAAPNATCPLSLKPILELEDPVEDQKGYVYERENIEGYIRESRGSVSCPAAATSHFVTMATLKKANKVIRLQKKAQRLGTQGQTQADADIVDVE